MSPTNYATSRLSKPASGRSSIPISRQQSCPLRFDGTRDEQVEKPPDEFNVIHPGTRAHGIRSTGSRLRGWLCELPSCDTNTNRGRRGDEAAGVPQSGL